MFGYIKPLEDELKVREMKLYRAVYCGLCNTSKKRISRFSRFFLSFDYTFFAIVHMLFTNEPIKMSKARCGFHLFAKKDALEANGSLILSCAIFSVLTYYKLCDTIKDEGFFRSLGARLLLPFAKHMRKKAIAAGFCEVDFIICDCLEKLSLYESKSDIAADELAGVFGEMMGHLTKTGLPEAEKETAYSVGYEVGKFIYITDAIDDLYSDEKRGTFNPYLREYGNAEDAKNQLIQIKNVLLHGTDLASDILSGKRNNLSPDKRQLCAVAQNILYLGCPAVIEGIFQKMQNITERTKINEKSI